MAGQRATDLTPIQLQPGYYTNAADKDAKSRYKDGNRVRFQQGFAEKIGGWLRQALTGANGGVYLGVARALLDWASLDGQFWVGIGTHSKLYVVNRLVLYDITPMRKASNLSNPFTTTNLSNVILVADPDHRANVGDYITVTASAAVGGLTLAGSYAIATVPTPDSYTFLAAGAATSAATGGGSVTIEYDIYAGLPENGELLGYGTGPYGGSTYGTPRAPGTGVPAAMRTWSLVQWGEDMVGAPNGGEIYWWQRSNGAAARASLIPTAPTNVRRLVMDKENKVLIAIGCSNVDGTPDAMRVRWTSREDLNLWVADLDDPSNTAGGRRLDYGSQMITGIPTRKMIALWSDTQMYIMQNIGDDYAVDPVGAMIIAGPNAAIDANGVVYIFGFGGFYRYDGVLQELPCDVWTKIFDGKAADSLDKTKLQAITASWNESFGEVKWLYPRKDGQMGYVIYNVAQGCWYYGIMERTAYGSVTEYLAVTKTPYAVNDGKVYLHEIGDDEDEGADGVNAMDYYIETHDFTAASDQFMLINTVTPDFDRLAVGLQFVLKKKRKPRDPAYKVRGPYTVLEDTVDKSVRCRGSQIALRIEALRDEDDEIVPGQSWRLGVWQSDMAAYGQR